MPRSDDLGGESFQLVRSLPNPTHDKGLRVNREDWGGNAVPFIETSDSSVFYEDSGGTGPAIIISHGFLMDHRMFDAQVEALSDYRLIRWDTRNHGRSHGNATAYSFWDQARDGLAILDHLGIDDAVFGGHSQGGFIALRMALLSPSACRGLMLFGTAAGAYTDREREGYRRMFTRWIEGIGSPDFEPMVWALASSMIGGDRERDQIPWRDRWLERDWSDFAPAIWSSTTPWKTFSPRSVPPHWLCEGQRIRPSPTRRSTRWSRDWAVLRRFGSSNSRHTARTSPIRTW
jgi:pimeloyl-ACP methyl ester carboxylesterase